MSIAKIEEIVGTSDKGWEDAAQVAVTEPQNSTWNTWNRNSRSDWASRS